MADAGRKPHKPMDRRNYSSSSSYSNSTKYRNSNYPKSSVPSRDSSWITPTKKSTTRNWDSDDGRRNDNDDGHQDYPTLVGTCPFMCPAEERARRERLRDLAVFERLHGNPAKTSPNLAVKKESDVESLCTDCALETSSDGTGKGLLPTKQSVITKSAGGLQKYYPLESQRIE
ncbi:UNVERIFIED_CONTAM: SAC3 family protein C, partial [Sesamum angustifolium]